jgi:hypothetical protein
MPTAAPSPTSPRSCRPDDPAGVVIGVDDLLRGIQWIGRGDQFAGDPAGLVVAGVGAGAVDVHVGHHPAEQVDGGGDGAEHVVTEETSGLPPTT